MGWTYNTDDNVPTTGPLITGVCVSLTLLSLITVCLRAYVRIGLLKAFGVDDAIISVTWFCAAGFAVVTIVQTKWGLGLKNIDDLPDENIFNFGLVQYMGAPFYITSILGFKLALLWSYLRFIPKGLYRNVTIGVIISTILHSCAFLIVQVNLCQPISLQWDPTITEGSCLPGVPFYTSMASLTIVFDVIVMGLPFPILLKSRIQNRKKLVLLGLFGLGLFITVIQIIRIQTVKQLANRLDSAPLILWSAVENNLGIIVANIPTLAPLVKYYNEKSQGSNQMSGYANHKTTGSRYANGTWSNRTPKAMELGSTHDATEMGSFEGHIVKGGDADSTENILEGPGITKRVEVVITRNELRS
ncbi:hypothetical protein QBC38DRAFT_214156 [Podospora fimiseda]|uniref:Rhodopsin domain-containing protein n=1 Tax=Podospora fimiseda TaxID=252190 RepID=A0AAN7BP43_9PEZI|nr:hypothetical protein QBC38DRAFT_214156 [Podospora fimiseda]